MRREESKRVDDGATVLTERAEDQTAGTSRSFGAAPTVSPWEDSFVEPGVQGKGALSAVEDMATLAAHPVAVRRPNQQRLPIVISSPHSGSIYPAEFVEASALAVSDLRKSEDCFVDEIVDSAVSLGAPIVAARFPRVFIDPNREAYELDPDMFTAPLPGHVKSHSPRVRGGLGSIAKVVAGGQRIYRTRLTPEEAEWRIDTFYRPYHMALSTLLDETRARFGYAILLDCHSMPSLAGQRYAQSDGSGALDIVLGDRYGRACRRSVVRGAEIVFSDAGYHTVRNAPYAGGFITENYGAPQKGIHALQVEINRGIYMDERRLMPTTGLGRLKRDFPDLLEALGTIPASFLRGAY